MATQPSDSVTYEQSDTLSEAHSLLDEHRDSVKITAGGQSLMLLMRQGLVDVDAIVDISGVDEITGVDAGDDVVEIGATTTYTDLRDHAVAEEYAVLGDAIDVIADTQVRNMGTVGGAVSHADPSLDIIPPLLALDARITKSSDDGTETVDLEEFFAGYMNTDLGPAELVESVEFDRPAGGDFGSAYEKHAIIEGGWPVVGVAAFVSLDDDRVETARVALSAVADTSVRAPSVESELSGEPATAEAIEAAAGEVVPDIDPISDISGSADYKESLAETLTRRALATAVERAGGELE